MIKLSLSQACAMLGIPALDTELEFFGVSNDTRALQAGNLYIAIKGANFDGHAYLSQAKAAGAVAAVVSEPVDCDFPQLCVPDTTLAMGQLAQYWREKFTLPIVGITGSCGKTTTTRMMSAILSQCGSTLFPEGNKNNQWGVPQTLFKLQAEHEFAVIEMGADRGGEIRYLTGIVQPDVAILTNVAPVHIEVSDGVGFGSLEGVFNEKSQIFRGLPATGTAIVCADEAYFSRWQTLLADSKYLSFGYADTADVCAKNLRVNAQLQYQFELCTPAGNVEVQLSSLGRHNVVNALAASAAALALGVDLPTIAAGLANVPTASRRMIKHSTPEGATLIDDSYNSNLKSAKAVIDMLADHPGPSIAVLGDMKEIGAQSAEFHREVGAYAKLKQIDHLFAFGEESIAMAQGFGDNAQHYLDVEPIAQAIKPLLSHDTLLVVKGSLSTGMDRIVNRLLK
jgi:UDP-N-acetylmuramoyl-tripeptide--D-alanyl-D-alanine ligase